MHRKGYELNMRKRGRKQVAALFLVATKRLYMSVCPSVGRSVGWSVTLSLFGQLGATNAVCTAPLLVFVYLSVRDLERSTQPAFRFF